MFSRDPQPLEHDRSRESQTHAQYLLLALSRAAQSIQRAHTAEDFYSAVGREIQSLGGNVALLLLNDDRQSFSIAYLSYAPGLIRKAEQMTGLSMREYRLPIVPGGIYDRTLHDRAAAYAESSIEILKEALPKPIRALSSPLSTIFNLRQSVAASLWVDDEPLGILSVDGPFLNRDDLPAMESFAGQIAAGLYNVRLMQKLEEELASRKLAEEALRISQSTFEGIFNSVTETIYIQDENGVFLDVNAGAEKMYGYPREHFIGRTPEFLSAPGRNDLVKIAGYVQQAFLGEPVEFEFWGLKKDGTIFPKDVRLTPGLYFGRNVVIAVARDITERRRAEEVLRANEAKIQALLDSVPDMMFVLSRDGQYLDYHAACEQLLYAPPDFFLGKNIREVMPAELVEVYFSTLDTVFRTGEGQLFEYSLDVAGEKHDFEAHIVPYLTDRILCVARDVSERKRMEKELHESERYYRALIENAADGILVINTNRGIEYESPSVFRLLGYGAEKMVRSDALGLVHPDDMDELFEAFRIGLETPGYIHRGEYRLKDEQGEWRYIEIVSQFLQDDPAIGGVIINGRDITDRKRAEEALRESESRFHSIVSESTDGIDLTDETGRIIEFNDALEDITGLKREDILGKYAWDVQIQITVESARTETMRQKMKDSFQQLLKTGSEKNFHTTAEVPIERADGIQRYIQIRKFSVRTEKGWRLGSIVRDITERKQAEEARQQQFRNLRSLYQMAAALGEASGLEEVFDTALCSLQDALAADRAAVLLFDPDGVMRFKSWRGLSETYRKIVEGHSPWKADDPDPQPVLVPDARTDPGLSHLAQAFEAEGIGSLAFIPMLYHGKLLGKFMIYYNEMHSYHEGEVQLAQTIARHVAFAISRQHADDALRASEEMYRILYEDNPSMYFTADENGTTLSVNKSGVSQLGFSPEELIGQPILSIFHPDDREGVRLQIESCLENPERTIQIEARKVDKSGRVRWVRESACAVRDIQGQSVVLVICDDITKRKQAEDELRHANRSLQAAHKELQQMFAHEQVLARTDALTGLFNRRHFFELAAREFNGSLRYQRPLALILFDVDGFKKANDTFGHAFGDDTLVKISQAAKSQVREVDILARYGGDEFIILMPETSAEQAFLIAERIRKEVETSDIDIDIDVDVDGIFLSATISLGIAEIIPDTDQSIEVIISRADKALYTAKQAGRNHAVIYSDG